MNALRAEKFKFRAWQVCAPAAWGALAQASVCEGGAFPGLCGCVAVAALLGQFGQALPGAAAQAGILQLLGGLGQQLLGFAPQLALQAGHARQVLQTGIARVGLGGGFYARQPGGIERVQPGLQGAHQLEGVVDTLQHAANTLDKSLNDVREKSGTVADRMAETATAMEEMNATVLEVARSSASSAASVDQARTMASRGEQVVIEAVNAIRAVHAQTSELQGAISNLGSQAEGISRIMNVISDIADQTNLLALNAAIEAARAGDAGRGFAVVADEVRKLAEKTMQATNEVGSAIQSIQQGTQASLQGMEKAAQAVEQATSLAHQSGEALKQIVVLTEDNSDQVRSIATAAEQQSATSEEINRAVDDVSRIATETVNGMAQAGTAVTRLAELVHDLEGLIDKLEAAGKGQNK